MSRRVWSSSYCLSCVFFNHKQYGTCKAFPEGIPHAIISGELSHFENVEGDRGIKFEQIEVKEK